MICLIASVAAADSWGPLQPETVPSASGRYVLHTDPSGQYAARPTRLSMTDGGAEIYTVDAANRIGPVDAWVSDDGYVVTSGEWGRAGYDHAIVIYDPSGHVVVDHHLDQVLTPAELLTNVRHSASSRWWIERDEPSFVDGHLVLRTDWGDEIRFRLSDGQQLRDGIPALISSRPDAFAQWLAEPSALATLEIRLDDIAMGRRGRVAVGTTCQVTEIGTDCTLWTRRDKAWHRPHEPRAFERVASSLVALRNHLVERCVAPDDDHTCVRVALLPQDIPGVGPNARLVYQAVVTEDLLRVDPAVRTAFDALLNLTGLPEWPR